MKNSLRFLKPACCLILIGVLSLNILACSGKVQATDLTADFSPRPVSGMDSDARFVGNTAEFSLALFQDSIAEGENSLVSPLSVLLALAMTANGADTETLVQMEAVLGGDIPLADLNEYLYTYMDNLPSGDDARLTLANSIWFRDDEDRLLVEQGFLQTNADYYNAAAYKSAFDDQTLKDINNWVEEKTEGMIDEILEEIAADAVMYLINALAFDARWETVYEEHDIFPDEFTTADGSVQQAEFMRSKERLFLDDGRARGFVKPYAGDKYSFVALLPNQGISVKEYVASLTGEHFLQLLNSATQTSVSTLMPKFNYDYTVQLNDVLKGMGMPTAFSKEDADFTRLAQSPQGNIYIEEVLHKTFIAVDELGTKAGAVTKVEMQPTSAPIIDEVVELDRPFVYAIIDNTTNLPIFIGTVMEINA